MCVCMYVCAHILQLLGVDNISNPFRDNVTTSDPDIEYRRPLYELIFRQLEEEGNSYCQTQLQITLSFWHLVSVCVVCMGVGIGTKLHHVN